jgi:tRNA(Ile2) C34 agmatinyltransferase TiaS
MGKLFYAAAIFCLVVGMLDSARGAGGEAAVLLLLAPVLALAGFGVSRASTKVCPQCSERVKKDALKCKHCGSAIAGERVPRPANEQRP